MSGKLTGAGSRQTKLPTINLVVIFSRRQFPPKIPGLGERINAFVSREDPMREKLLFRIQKA